MSNLIRCIQLLKKSNASMPMPAKWRKEILDAFDIIKRIQDALGTQETGEALIEVARNAHRAEMELASTYNFEEFPSND